MRYLPISKIPLVEEAEATGEVAESFDKLRSVLGIPSVSPGDMAKANSPAVLTAMTDLTINFVQQTILPPPLLFMIHYTISATRDCVCCSAVFQSLCRSVGVNEEMLDALISDLDSVAPERVREIIKFSVKCALEPLSLTEADYDRVREHGVSEQELVELIFWAGYALLNDTISDAAKLDDPVRQQVIED